MLFWNLRRDRRRSLWLEVLIADISESWATVLTDRLFSLTALTASIKELTLERELESWVGGEEWPVEFYDGFVGVTPEGGFCICWTWTREFTALCFSNRPHKTKITRKTDGKKFRTVERENREERVDRMRAKIGTRIKISFWVSNGHTGGGCNAFGCGNAPVGAWYWFWFIMINYSDSLLDSLNYSR